MTHMNAETTVPRTGRILPGSFQPPIVEPTALAPTPPAPSAPVSAWADQTGLADIVVHPFATSLARVTVTPLVTGKFRIIGTASFSNTSAANEHTVTLGAGIDTGVPVLMYQGSGTSARPGAGGRSTACAVVWESGVLGPVGSPVTIALISIADDDSGEIQCLSPLGSQISVEELQA